MAKGDQNEEKYTIDEIVGHTRKEKVIKEGSDLAYDEDELKTSKCQYAFRVKWVGYEDEDTWQSYESFEDKKLPKNYGRMNGIELFPSTERNFTPANDIVRLVKAIEAKDRNRHSSASTGSPISSAPPSPRQGNKRDNLDSKKEKKKTTTRPSEGDHNVVVLSSDNEDDEAIKKEEKKGNKRVEINSMKRKNGTGVNASSDGSDSSSVIKFDKVKGFKIRMSSEEKGGRKKPEGERRGRNSDEKERTSMKNDRDSDAMEKKKKRRIEMQSSDNDDSEPEEKKSKRESKVSKQKGGIENARTKKTTKGFSHGDAVEKGRESVDLSEGNRRNKKKRDTEKDDGMSVVLEKVNRISNESVNRAQEEKRTSMRERPIEKMEKKSGIPMGRRSKPTKMEEPELSDSSDSEDSEDSEDSGDSEGSVDTVDSDDEGWQFEKIITHVTVKEVKEGRDVEEKNKLNWKKIRKSQLPIIFRISCRHPTGYLKKDWLTIEELDDLPALNKYCSTSKLVLPKDYASMMKKKVKENDDLYDSG